jgi:NADH-quinone oxidoreductase subunit H
VTLLIFAVIPVAKDATLADLNIGILYIVAVASLGGMGVVMAGWACHNKYSLIGAMREISQMVSYEVPVVVSIVGVVMITGSLSMTQIVEAKGVPFILLQPLGFLIYFVAVLAQVNRSPLDQVEAESELVSGFHTEYSGMKFALFYLGEYGNAFAVSAIVTTLFLGGWKGPLLPPYIWFVIKALIVMYVLVWFRATFPRVRIDQVTAFAWKFLLPLALFNILVTGIELAIWPEFPWWLLFVNIPVAGALIFLWSRLFTLQGGQRVEV